MKNCDNEPNNLPKNSLNIHEYNKNEVTTL